MPGTLFSSRLSALCGALESHQFSCSDVCCRRLLWGGSSMLLSGDCIHSFLRPFSQETFVKKM